MAVRPPHRPHRRAVRAGRRGGPEEVDAPLRHQVPVREGQGRCMGPEDATGKGRGGETVVAGGRLVHVKSAAKVRLSNTDECGEVATQ